MVEMAIVLGVVGLVMGGVWTLAVKVQQTARVKQAVEQVIALNKNIRNYYQTQACIPNGNQTATLLGLGQPIFPREMLSGGGVVDLWNGGVQVLGANAGCDYVFRLSYLALPAETCAELVPKLTAAGEASRGLIAVTINGGAPLANLPPNPSDIIGTGAAQCNAAATAAVTLDYKLRVSD